MKLLLETNKDGNLVLRQDGLKASRFLIGIPVFCFGLVLLYGVVSAPVIALQQDTSLPNALLGAVVMLLFAAITLPMGWWMLFSRFWIVLDLGLQQVTEVSDWRIGRKNKVTPFGQFRTIRLAVEHLSGDPHRDNRRGNTHIQMIRLLSHNTLNQPSIELGWLNFRDRNQAEELAKEISRQTNLPLQIVESDEPVPTPVEEMMMHHDDEEAENDELTPYKKLGSSA